MHIKLCITDKKERRMNMKNAKRPIMILSAAVCALSLSACGNINGGVEQNSDNTTLPPVTEAVQTMTSPETSMTLPEDEGEPCIILSADPDTGEVERIERNVESTSTSAPVTQEIIETLTDDPDGNVGIKKTTSATAIVSEGENFVVTDPRSGESMQVTAAASREPVPNDTFDHALTSGQTPTGASVEVKDGVTYVDGVIIVNKTYSLPHDYGTGLVPEAEAAFYEMAGAAANEGIWLYIISGYRSYWYQDQLYWGYYSWRGEETDRFSARAGHSEHQTGLAMDVNDATMNFVGTPEAQWLAQHCVEYGFIIRYPENKEEATGFMYEPWHIRYLGKEKAKQIADSGLCLEEYYGLTSVYPEDGSQSEGGQVTQAPEAPVPQEDTTTTSAVSAWIRDW